MSEHFLRALCALCFVLFVFVFVRARARVCDTVLCYCGHFFFLSCSVSKFTEAGGLL